MADEQAQEGFPEVEGKVEGGMKEGREEEGHKRSRPFDTTNRPGGGVKTTPWNSSTRTTLLASLLWPHRDYAADEESEDRRRLCGQQYD